MTIHDADAKHYALTTGLDESYDTALAIIGMSGRFPGARDVETFWQNIATGVKSIHHFSDEELLAAGVDPQLLAQPNYVKAGTVLEDIDRFDASFFKFSPREAEVLDPQHRMFLECASEALESAGYDCETYKGPVGVFAGSAFSTYLLNNIFANPEVIELIGNIQASIGNDRDSLASTVSYKLNLRGPSFAVQTFCSTSLVAVHLACQSLLNYECDIALAGGVAIQLPQVSGYLYEEGSIVSPDGECRTFDANGRGSVMGNGAGVVTLKRLQEAIEDNDYIYAIIRGSAINNDGSVRVSYTAPGLGGQSEVIAQAYSNAGVPVESISYIEAHGTATMLGDAVELAAMQKAFGLSTQKKGFCAIGSVKPNIGHLDRASGVTGLIKTSLALHHQLIPPSLNFEHSSPDIDLGNSPFYVNTQLAAWPANKTPRRAGVSSFGLGGTNVHVVLEEAPTPAPVSPSRPWQLLVVSAKTETARKTAAKNLAAHLKSHPELPLADAAYTLQVGRSAFNHRQIVVCRDRGDAIAALETTDPRRTHIQYQEQRDREVTFLFPGGSEHYANVTQELYQQEAMFREAVDNCSALLQPILGLDLREVMYSKQLHDETVAPLVIFVIEYALAQLLMQWGIRPQAMIGYKFGEFVAACLSDVLSLEDALLLVTRYSQLSQTLPAGAVLTEALTQVARQVRLHEPQIPYLSNVTGTWITAEQATDPAYWAEQMGQTHHFANNVNHLLQQNKRVLVEVGVGRYGSSNPFGHTDPSPISTLPSSNERHSEQEFLLTAIGKLWLAGVSIDWKGFYADERRRRLPLPTYPFEKQRHWIDEPGAKRLQETVLHVDTGKKPDIADWFYSASWEETALPATPNKAETRQPLPVLLFMDSTGLGEQVAQRLTQQGHEIVRIFEGKDFTRLDERTYGIRPDHPGDYTQLITELAAAQRMGATILHCWSITQDNTSISSVANRSAHFNNRQDRGFYSLIYLAQALEAQLFEESLQVVVISNQIHSVTGQEALCPEKSTILGACKVIPQENLNIFCRSIDLEIPPSGEWADSPVLDQLVAECLSRDSDLIVAYRGTTRRVQTFAPTRLEARDASAPGLRQHGVYLITGGMGGIGPVLAHYLATHVQARLVLVGRSTFPLRAEWSSWLANHDDHEQTGRTIRLLQASEAAGAELLLLQADVGDAAQMQAVIQQSVQHFGAIHGVIHAAGITSESAFRPLQTLGKAECEQHFRPKVHGVFALEQALHGVALDFCLLFSSISAVLGGLGFTAYTAANLFMDAFVQQHNRSSDTPWLSVNWDTWQVKQDVHGVLGVTVDIFAMTPEEGTEAFARVLSSGLTQLINSTGDLQARIRQWIQLESVTGRDESIPVDENIPQGKSRPALSSEYVSASSEYERTIASIWQQALGIAQVGLYDNFFDLGGNSLIALQVIARLKKAFHMQVSPVALFEAPTISALVHYLLPAPAATPASDTATALLARRRSLAQQTVAQHDIAILGMSGRFPGAPTLEQFWHNLRDGVESVRVFTDAELLASGVDPTLLRDPHYVKARPILEDISLFDAAFFGYSPREAALTDPQHRLFLECCWDALEAAAYAPASYDGLIGVFGGTNISTYLLGLASDPDTLRGVDQYQLVIGNDKDSLTTSVSYKLNLKGPSFAVQTFCSTSLVAVHLACQSLLHGECDLALAGGVSLRVPTVAGHLYQEGGMESPDGHCRTFDAQAKGGLFGDGVGVVVLKRLSEALADGDPIRAVIKGSAINNDGSLKVSYTAPSVVGQAAVVTSALQAANVPAESIGYIEAHGTATELGDPIEVASLTKAFQTQTAQTGFCAIGSVKTNIGHLDRAAGVSGLIKTVLALEQAQLPPSLHFQSPNPAIDFVHSPFYVNTRLSPWPRRDTPRRAGINSLGMGGTNVHVIVEEAPPRAASGPSRPVQLLLLSAKTPSALEAMTSRLHDALQQHPQASLPDVAYTLQVGRSRFEQRRMLLCHTHDEALAQLAGTSSSTTMTSHVEQRTDRPVAFLFAGVGEAYPGMAHELYTHEPIFRQTVDRCAALLHPLLGRDIREDITTPATDTPPSHNGTAHSQPAMDLRSLLGRNGSTGQAATTTEAAFMQTQEAQPLLFVIEYALAQLLMQWGIHPQAMLGYSLGEYVAACLAGVFSLEDALHVVARRAQLIAALPPGTMLAVALSEQDVQPYLSDTVCLAAVNAPTTCVLAGPLDAMAQLEARLTRQGIAARRVATTHAFHSSMLAPVQHELTRIVEQVRLHAPQIPYLSNVTGTWITDAQATDAAYWAQHLCQTVRFAQSVEQLLQQSEQALVEIGVGQALGSFVKQQALASGGGWLPLVVPTLPSVTERQSGQALLLKAVGTLWLSGVTIDWPGFYAGERRLRLTLPTYPFERQRYWLEPRKRIVPSQSSDVGSGDPQAILSNLKMEELSDWFYLPGWKQAPPPISSVLSKSNNCWLLFLDDCGIGTYIKQMLVQYEQEVITVAPGEAFRKIGEGAYTVHPTAKNDYEALLKALRAEGKLPQRVVHLWTVFAEKSLPETPLHKQQMADDQFTTILERGFYSLLALAQALGEQAMDSCHISVISNDMQDVTGNEQLCVEKATVIGPCKVIPQEYPNISSQSIDITLPQPGSWQEEELLQLLIGELIAKPEDTVVALRGNRRWIQNFEPMRLAEEQTQHTRLRERGVYVITGGLGGIGLAMAEYLAHTVQARLILTSRKGLPPRSTWASILEAQGEMEGIGQQIRKVQQLEEAGAEVLAIQANVANEAQMQTVIQQTIASFGTIHGVLHAAGVPGVGLMQLKTAEQAEQVLSPKVQGTRVLERVLQGLSLDFLVLFSSITSTTGGGPGQVDYCAANAFLDAYAHRHFAQHGMTVAVNWGEWQWNAWEAGLGGYDPAAQAFFRENRRRFGIDFEQGTEALRRVLSRRFPQVIVSTQDFRVMVELSRSYTATTMLQQTRKSHETKELHPRPSLGSEYAAPRNDLERRIAAIWQELLGVAEIGIDDNFFEMGGNSLIGLDLIGRLRKELKAEALPSYVLYEAPTVSAMAQYVEQNKTTGAVEVRYERGERRRENLKQRMMTDVKKGR